MEPRSTHVNVLFYHETAGELYLSRSTTYLDDLVDVQYAVENALQFDHAVAQSPYAWHVVLIESSLLMKEGGLSLLAALRSRHPNAVVGLEFRGSKPPEIPGLPVDVIWCEAADDLDAWVATMRSLVRTVRTS